MVYIVEDDESIRGMEAYALKSGGFEVMEFSNASDFLAQCEKGTPTVALLDIMLPGIDGLTLLRKIREDPALRHIGVIMVTARSAELDAVLGLDKGADDYIAKPFGVMELISRVKALSRRIESVQDRILTLGNITLDDKRHLVISCGEEVTLTYKEYELLKHLMEDPGVVMSRGQLMDSVWGVDYEGGSRTVDMHVKTLRQKLGEGGAHIKTVRNVGYKIE